MLRFLFRPSILIALSAAVVGGAIVVLFQRPPTQGRPTPLPVSDGEREIVWLYPATSAATWQRFVAAVRRTAQRGQADIQADDRSAFPSETTTVPQVSLSIGAAGGRLVFRWYKLTGDWKTSDWIAALLNRQPPPLAIVGGSNSDSARELAFHLNTAANNLPAAERPLLLLTTATADRVAPPGSGENDNADKERRIKLTRLYPGRTFRFCFSNEQIAMAVSDFIWRRDDLRPRQAPVLMTQWNDDSYSRDLIDGFHGALRHIIAREIASMYLCFLPPASAVPWQPVWHRDCVASWNNFTYRAVGGGWPPGRNGGIFPLDWYAYEDSVGPHNASDFRLALPAIPQQIASSVGAFSTPNPYEAKAAADTIDAWRNQWQPQQLLLVAGQSQPSRRFLRGLMRCSPALSQNARILVATGDALAFNTVYRDGQAAWNIQDLPFPLVFFCHRNPIDADAGFRREARSKGDADTTAETGTEDVLLFGDIVEALVQMAVAREMLPTPAAAWAERLAEARQEEDRIVFDGRGLKLFDGEGQRRSGSGEHVVFLQPMWNDQNDRVLPQAHLEVWAWRYRDRDHVEDGQIWERCGEPLTVRYNDAAPGGGGQHGE